MKKLLLIVIIFGSSAAMAQLFGTPRPPKNLAPLTQRQSGAIGGLTTFDTDFLWQGNRFGTGTAPLPTHFAFCIYDATSTTPCSWTGSSFTMLSTGGNGLAPPVAIPSLPGQPINLDYQYTFNPTGNLADTLLDKPLKWTAGACVANAMATGGMACSFAAPRDAFFTVHNITASNADMGNSTATNLAVDSRATASSALMTDSGPFETWAHVWQAMRGTAAGGAPICRTDVNHADFRDVPPNVFHYAFFRTKREVLIRDLPGAAGAKDGTGVIAIYRTGSFYNANFGPWLGLLPTTSGRGVLVSNFPVTTTGKAFVATTHIDPANINIETNEADNVNSRCMAF